jgi:hypothetical protein
VVGAGGLERDNEPLIRILNKDDDSSCYRDPTNWQIKNGRMTGSAITLNCFCAGNI